MVYINKRFTKHIIEESRRVIHYSLVFLWTFFQLLKFSSYKFCLKSSKRNPWKPRFCSKDDIEMVSSDFQSRRRFRIDESGRSTTPRPRNVAQTERDLGKSRNSKSKQTSPSRSIRVQLEIAQTRWSGLGVPSPSSDGWKSGICSKTRMAKYNRYQVNMLFYNCYSTFGLIRTRSLRYGLHDFLQIKLETHHASQVK